MIVRGTIAGRSRAPAVLGILVALSLPAAGTATPVTARAETPKQSPKPGSLGRARPALVYEKIRYDSLLSVNEQCPVRGGKLNPSIRPMYVNRHPVGFC